MKQAVLSLETAGARANAEAVLRTLTRAGLARKAQPGSSLVPRERLLSASEEKLYIASSALLRRSVVRQGCVAGI